MNNQELQQLNINNLTSLWRMMGINKNSEWNKNSLIVSASWPNRYWFDWDANIQQINSVVSELHQLPAAAVVPVWLGAGQVVGTALVYQTGDIIGVHLVGVSEPYRGRGFARKIMQQVIKLSIAMGGKYLTLQASAAGEPLYLQLGFVPQFEIRNYKRNL